MWILLVLQVFSLVVSAIPPIQRSLVDANPLGQPFKNAVLPVAPGFSPRYSLFKRQGCPNLTLLCPSGVCCSYSTSCCGNTCCASGYLCTGGTSSAPCCVAIGSPTNTCGGGNPCSRPGDLPCQGINICCPPSNLCYYDSGGAARCSPLGSGPSSTTPTPIPRSTPTSYSNYYSYSSSYSDSDASSYYSPYRYPTTTSTSSYIYGGSGGTSSSSGTFTSSTSGHGVSAGLIAGVVVGSLVGAAIIIFLIWWIIKKWRERHSDVKIPPWDLPVSDTSHSSSASSRSRVEEDDAAIIASKPAGFTGLVNADHYPILYPSLQKGDIRVLEILKPKPTTTDVDAPIVCRLWVHTIEPQPGKAVTQHWPGYEALSYVWAQQPRDLSKTGKPAVITVINAHDDSVKAKFIIGWNVNEALKFFRRKNCSRIMWTDQLCINQKEEKKVPQKEGEKQDKKKKDSEKMQQVLMMKTIYECAQQVQVWLGPSIPESKEAARYFAPFDGRPVTDEELMRSYRSAKTQWEALYDGFQNRPWWSRAWIVQEVILAANPVLNSGPDSISLNLFLRLIEFTADKEINLATSKSLVNGTIRFPTLEMVVIRKRLQSGRKTHLSEWLSTFHNQSATDPRDRIFAYLGLGYHENDLPRQTTWGDPIEHVWAEGTRLALYLSNNYDFICLGRGLDWGIPGEDNDYIPPNPEDRNKTEKDLDRPLELPSWVPNFRVDEGDGRTSACQLPLHYHPNNPSVYNACGNLRTLSYTEGFKELEVYGVFIDKVKIVSTPNFSSNEGVDGEAFMAEVFKLFGENFSYCCDNCSWDSCTHYPSPRGGSYPLALGKTMVMDLDFEGGRLDPREGFHTLQNQLDNPPDSFQPAVTHPDIRRVLWNKKLYEEKSKWSNWRRFIITEKGYVGMAHRDCRVGDSIYIIGGATVPFVLREDNPSTFPKDEKLKFVGESYLHGFMDGEVTDRMETRGIGDHLVLV
ncbi:heterokaryon incompatibility protein-domain-containing protein [Paraphoma chrysanthemicola]|uniref:Heterokaryon incompatibility protein-domain-containing protein n=1 Tax=Paraphoma chrysanthemicola TaxID=798071 RepID=A0A8K0R934_9PLEO|nr:heterokaryon incompatibility protein-domain-containing protein [Paraphoma chrysanthemicola]